MRVKKTTAVLGALAVLGGFAGSAQTEVFIKQATHTDEVEIMGQLQPGRDDTTTMWLAENKALMMTNEGMAFLLEVDQGIMYAIDHQAKNYTEMPMDFFSSLEETTGVEDDEEAAQKLKMIQDMAGGMMANIEITVTSTDEQKKVKDWATRKYVVETKMGMMSTVSEMWVAEELEVDYKLYHAINNVMMAGMPGFQEFMKRMQAEMEKVKGIPVLSVAENEVMGQKIRTTMELLEYTEKDAPAGTFQIPDDYKKVAMDEMRSVER